MTDKYTSHWFVNTVTGESCSIIHHFIVENIELLVLRDRTNGSLRYMTDSNLFYSQHKRFNNPDYEVPRSNTEDYGGRRHD